MSQELDDRKLYRIQLIAVVVGVVLLGAKFLAYVLTHSNAILTDALESIINVVAGSFALYSLYLSSKPKDADHPYGHGKVEFLSAGLEGAMIIVAGAFIIGKAAFTFFYPNQLEHLGIGVIIIGLSGIVNLIIGLSLKRTGEKHNSLTLTADGQHLLTDAYSSFALTAGVFLIWLTGWQVLDNVTAIIFGAFILYTGIKLVRRSLSGIMDEADDTIDNAIVTHLSSQRKNQWIDIHNLRTIRYGSKLHVDCHVTLPWYNTLEEAHKEIEEISAIINETYPTQVEFFIHGDPCIPESCRICMISDCKVRQHTFERKIDWTVENVRMNKKHCVKDKE